MLRVEIFKKKLQVYIFVIPWIVVGSVLLIVTKAATTSVGLEVESGVLTGDAKIVNDSNASNGKAVVFGDTKNSLPAQCKSGGTYLWENLESCGWVGTKNTGVDTTKCPNGLTKLGAKSTDYIDIRTANTVIECKNVIGGLRVYAQNVTIKNSKVTYNAGGGLGVGGTGVIKIFDDASATIDQVELDGLNGTHACVFNLGVKGISLPYSMVVRKVNCHNTNDGIFNWFSGPGSRYPSKYPNTASDFIIENSFFHDFTEGAANGHIDGFQTEGTSNGVIKGNTFKITKRLNDVHVEGGTLNSAMAIWNNSNSVTNYKVSNNLIAGGGFAVYVYDRNPSVSNPTSGGQGVGGFSVTDVQMNDNSFSNYFNNCIGKYGAWFFRSEWSPYYGGPTDGWHRKGNTVIETGENLDSGNPHKPYGSLCI